MSSEMPIMTCSIPSRAAARRAGVVVVLLLAGLIAEPLAQTVIKPPKNKYTPQQDVEVGREAAAEVRKKYPIIRDERISEYLTTIGHRLVAAAPSDLKEPVFEY